jgi:hypothetical protein
MAVTSEDFIITDDIQIEDGDFKIDVSDNQNVYAILQAHRGQFYEFPLIGLGIDDFQNSPQTNRFLRKRIKEELAKDNYVARNIEIIGEIDDFTVNILPEKIK